MIRTAILIVGVLSVMAGIVKTGPAGADEDVVAFAVVSELPKDKARVPAKVALDGSVTDMRIASLRSHPLEFGLEEIGNLSRAKARRAKVFRGIPDPYGARHRRGHVTDGITGFCG